MMGTTRRQLNLIGDIRNKISILKHSTNHNMSDSNYDNPIKYNTLALSLHTSYINEVLEQKYVVLSVGAYEKREEFLDISEAVSKYNEIVNMINGGH